MPQLKNPKLSILSPVRNEGMNIELMLKILSATVEINHETLIIYDDPEDNTVPVVKKIQRKYPSVKLVLNQAGRGVVNAVKTGVQSAKGEFILILAADDVGPILAVSDMIELLEQGCDFVSCTRYAHGGRRLGGSFIQGILSKTANWLFYKTTSSVLTDCTTGLKAFRKKVFDNLTLESKPIGWAFVFELAVKVQAAGMKLGEVPIVSIDRLYGGKSSFSLGPWSKEYLRWFIWGIRNLPLAKRKAKVKVHIPTSTAL